MPSSAASSSRTTRIIVADDDPALRTLLGAALGQEGYDVAEAATGAELFHEVQRRVTAHEDVDLIISDVRMPKMTGLRVLAELRELGLRVPVILISGYSDFAARKEAVVHGALLLDKPVELRALRLAVKAALDGAHGAHGAHGPATAAR